MELLVIEPNDPCNNLLGSGNDQLLGTLMFDPVTPGVCPTGVQWIPSYTLGSVDHPNTIIDDAFVDHHPELSMESGCTIFIRGDCNNSAAWDIGDVIYLLGDVLFDPAGIQQQNVPDCIDACDSNDDGNVDAIDAALVLQLTAGLLESL